MVPHLTTALAGPLHDLERKLLAAIPDIERWLRSQWQEHAAPFYASVDLRMQCCIQVLTFAWREGISAEESRRWFEEARQLALAAGNARANAWIHAAYGRTLAVSGSADDYVERTREALALATKMQDRSAEAMMTAVLSQAVRLSGRLDEALQANIEATGRADAISEFDRQLFSFDVGRWLTAMRGQVLVQSSERSALHAFLPRWRALLERMRQQRVRWVIDVDPLAFA